MVKSKFIRRWIPISNKKINKEYYKKKYNTNSVLENFGIESVRDGKIGTNVEFLIILDKDTNLNKTKIRGCKNKSKKDFKKCVFREIRNL